MLVDRLEFDSNDEVSTIESPSWREIKEAIHTLHNSDRADGLTISIGEEQLHSLSIDGCANEFTVMAVTKRGDFHYLLDSSRGNTETVRRVGGQLISWPDRHITNLDVTLKAAKTFAKTGEVDRSLSWELG